MAEENGSPGATVFFPELRIQSWKRLLQDHGRRDGAGGALARSNMEPAAGTAYLPGPDSRIESVQLSSGAEKPPVAAPAPAPPLNPPSPIPGRFFWELGHEADVRMPGRTRGETRTIRDSHHRMGLMPMSDHAWAAKKMANREAFDEALRGH